MVTAIKFFCFFYCNHHFETRNLQKKAKKKRYEEEKAFMERLRTAGCSAGEYAGDGLGESTSTELQCTEEGPVEASPETEHLELEEDDDDVRIDSGCDDHHPLLIFYDCEATGLSIYSDHITDLAAKVVACPVPLKQPSFSSLVRTTRHISAPGKKIKFKSILVSHSYLFKIVTRLTGISQTMLRNEQPLSAVLPQFLQWISTVTAEVSDATSITHFPGTAINSL